MISTVTDFYKVDHIRQYPKGLNKVYSNFTPRSSRLFNRSSEYDNKVLVFGLQRVIKDLLIGEWNKTFFNQSSSVLLQHGKLIKETIGEIDMKCWKDLHELGYLPIEIKALEEGTRSPIKVPVFTITNTLPEFAWLVNYLETSLSTELWKGYTNATTAFEFRRVFEKYASMTGVDKEFVKFQGHDFSMRGLSNRHDAYTNSISHLTCFYGTDTIPAIQGAIDFYKADTTKELVGTSVFASEHSTITMQIANYISQRRKNLLKIASTLPDRSDGWLNSDWQTDLNDAIKDEFKYLQDADGSYYEIIDEAQVKSISKNDCLARCNMDLDNLDDRHIAEYEVLKYMIEEVYPTGIYSHVSDSYDYWYTISNTVKKLKDYIIDRNLKDSNAKLVLRPDSGDAEKIICGLRIKDLAPLLSDINHHDKLIHEIAIFAYNHINTAYYDGFFYEGKSYDWKGNIIQEEAIKGSLEILWEIFGGEINDKGYKVLHPAIGLIYGDSITIARAESILKRMEAMKFASSNVVFGIGSFSYQYNTRDSLGFAMKATYGEVDNRQIEVFKDPLTDSGTKKSAKGLLRVEKYDNEIQLFDQQRPEDERTGLLETVFKDGVITKETSLKEIREKIDNELNKI